MEEKTINEIEEEAIQHTIGCTGCDNPYHKLKREEIKVSYAPILSKLTIRKHCGKQMAVVHIWGASEDCKEHPNYDKFFNTHICVCKGCNYTITPSGID